MSLSTLSLVIKVILELLKHQDCALVAGCSIAPEPRPLRVTLMVSVIF